MRNCEVIFLCIMIFATIIVFVFLLKHLKTDMKEKRCFRAQNILIAETSFFDQVQVGDALRNPITVFCFSH